jgi:ABC-type molybdate transport system substrate-binding protein
VNRYSIGIVGTYDTDAAVDFTAWVLSSEGQAVLARYGFGQP